MWESEARAFYREILIAGAVVTAFCGVFLKLHTHWAIRRGTPIDVVRERASLSGPLVLSLMAVACSGLFGIVFPLLALRGTRWFLARAEMAAAGLVAGLVLCSAHLLAEIVTFRRASGDHIAENGEWNRQWAAVVVGVLMAALAACSVFDSLESAT